MRRLLLSALAILLAASVGTACSGRIPSASPPRSHAKEPNFVFLLTDDLDSASISVMPRLKSLIADQGVTLSRYYVSLSWCCPSRATTLRGQYTHNTRVWRNTPPNGGFYQFHRLGEESSTIATWLHKGGYRTGLFGKYLNGFPGQGHVPRTYIPPGWDTWVVPVAGLPYTQYDYTLNETGKLRRHGHADSDYLTDVLNQKAREFISAKDSRPFFAYVSVYNPHAPATPAPRHQKLFGDAKAPRTKSYDEANLTGKPAPVRYLGRISAEERGVYDELYRQRLRSLQSVDEMIGDLITTLRDTGRLNNTYFIFTSDNGFHIGQHRLPPGKNTAYEEDIRVPFMIRGPGVPKGRTVDLMAGNVDLAPTFADLAGVQAPPFVDGRSLRPLWESKPPKNWRKVFLLEHAAGLRPPVKPKGTLEPPELNAPDQRQRFYIGEFWGLRTSRYLYVEYATGEKELYDLVTDPDEMHNLVPDPRVTAPLSALLKHLITCHAQTCRDWESRAG